MKKLLACLIIAPIVGFTFLPDGGRYTEEKELNYYERTHNLQYVGIDDSIQLRDKKNKIDEKYITANVAIYDIKNNKITYLFPDQPKLTIIGFHFESSYIEEFKTVEFNNNYDPTNDYEPGLFEFSNNKNIAKRELSDNLIVATLNERTGEKAVWICTKTGADLKKVLDFGRYTDYEIDVYNRKVRIIEPDQKKIEITSADY